MHLTVIGDSLAFGTGATDGRHNFAGLLYTYVVGRRPGSTIKNLGIPGATARQIETREVPRLKPAPCSVIVVIAGANDVQQYVMPMQFSADYDRLLGTVRREAPEAAIVVTNVPDVALSRIIVPPVKPVIARLCILDSNAIAAAATKHKAWNVDLFSLSLKEAKERVELLSRDGIHPNNRGYAVMAAAAYPVIDRALR